MIGSCSSSGSLSTSDDLMKALSELSQKFIKALDYSKEEDTQKVAVYIDKSDNRDVDIVLGDQLVAGFAKSGKYIAVERTNAFLKQLGKEVGYQKSGAVDDNELISLGKQFGVKYVCVAKTMKWGGKYFVSSRLVDVETTGVPNMYNAENYSLNNVRDVVNMSLTIVSNLIGTSSKSPKDKVFTETAFGINMKMIWVEGGEFMMGCTSEQSNCESNEQNVRCVTVDGFYIGMLEVTQAQWQAVMGTSVYGSPAPGVGSDYPMYCVSWNGAMEFCRLLSDKTGKTYTLPTEAQWEYAARGGNRPDGTKYAGSNMIDAVAWCYPNSGSSTHPCGSKRANSLGIYDMSGNVWEWCKDRYSSSYTSYDTNNPTGPSSGATRVCRGGGWNGSGAPFCRVAYRKDYSPNTHFNALGFRVVLLP